MTPGQHRPPPAVLLTPEHYRTRLPLLDTSGKLTVYRICRTRYADLSGMGAYKTGGRWNSKNERAVYTSVEVGTAVLEVFSYLDRDPREFDHYSLMTISLDAASCASLSTEKLAWKRPDPAVLPQDKLDRVLLTYRSLEDAVIWAQRPHNYVTERGVQSLLGLIAPSILAPAYNVVLYPDNPAFASLVKIESVQPFSFHPYLFGERAASKGN